MNKTSISIITAILIIIIGVFVWFRFFKTDSPAPESEGTEEITEETSDSEEIPEGEDTTPSGTTDSAFDTLIKAHVAKEFGVNQSSVTIVSKTSQNWPDACLGLGEKGSVCAQVITPGYRVIASTGTSQYTYRTNETGTLIRKE